jgi:hypothetical protein
MNRPARRRLTFSRGALRPRPPLPEIATYTSLTEWRGRRTLWYPDRKHFLLGKYLTDALHADMKVPQE